MKKVTDNNRRTQGTKKNATRQSNANNKTSAHEKQVEKPLYLEESNYKTFKDKKTFRIAQLIIFVFAFLIYSNTIEYGYVFDDPIVITRNEYTKQGFAGIPKMLTTDSFAGIFGEHGGIIAGGRYRPLSLITFAIEYEFLQENPMVSHIVNILMYAFSCLILFNIFVKLFSFDGIYRARWLAVFRNQPWFLSIPFIAILLFVAHPIHTEVVANIKERDDIMALLGAVAAMFFALKYFENNKIMNLVWCAVLFILSLLSKENVICFVALIPLTAHFFTTVKTKPILSMFFLLSIAGGVYMIFRLSVLGNAAQNNIPNKLMNDPFLEADGLERIGTIIYTMGYYLKLMVFPHPLTVDYYPYHIELTQLYSPWVLLTIVFYAVAAYFSLKTLKQKNIYAFAFLFFMGNIALYTNILFPIGTFLTERFLYIGVLGFTLAFSYFMLHGLPQYLNTKNIVFKNKKYILSMSLLFAVILTLYTGKTMSRNTVWSDDFTLYSHDVETSTGSAKSNHVMGELYLYRSRSEKNKAKKDSLLDLSIKYSAKGVEIHRNYIRCLHNLGAAIIERDSTLIDSAGVYFLRALEAQPYYIDTHKYLNMHLNTIPEKNVFTTYRIDDAVFKSLANYNIPEPVLSQLHTLKDIKYRTGASMMQSVQEKVGAQAANSLKDFLLKSANKTNDKKIDFIKKMLVHAGSDYTLNSNIGVLYLQNNDMEKAYYYLELATRIQTNDNKAADYNNLGVVFQRRSLAATTEAMRIAELKKSIEWLTKACKAAPTNAQYRRNLGNMYIMIGDKENGQKHIAKSQQLSN